MAACSTTSHVGEMPPPTYNDATAFGLMFKDFLPGKDIYGFSDKTCTFRDLVVMANTWLQQSPNISVKSCENVVHKVRSKMLEPERMSWHVSHNHRMYYARGLRIWYVKQPHESHQQLSYLTVVPHSFTGEELGDARIGHTFESLRNVLERTNKRLDAKPLGHIINIELYRVKHKNSGNEPESLFWSEAGMEDKGILSSWTIVYCLNIYYFKAPAADTEYAQIGYTDFSPSSSGDDNGGEPISSLIAAARSWSTSRHLVRCTNIQTLTAKLKERGLAKDRLHYDNAPTAYMSHMFGRFVRLWYVTHRLAAEGAVSGDPLRVMVNAPVINHIDFVPRPNMKHGSRSRTFKDSESLSSIGQRINDWVTKTGARIFCCETLSYLLDDSCHYDPKESTTLTEYKTGKRESYWFHMVRVYMDGEYGGDGSTEQDHDYTSH